MTNKQDKNNIVTGGTGDYNERFIKFKYCLYNKIVLYKISKLQQTDVEVGPPIDIYYNYRKYLIFLIILS